MRLATDLQVEHLKEVNQVDVNQYILYQKGLREILQTILIHVVKDAKPLEYFHTLFHHHALPSVTTILAMTPNLNQNMSPPLHYHGKAEGHGSAKFIFRASWHYL